MKYRNELYFFTFSILALMATTIVLTVIKTVPAAGLDKTPGLYKTHLHANTKLLDNKIKVLNNHRIK